MRDWGRVIVLLVVTLTGVSCSEGMSQPELQIESSRPEAQSADSVGGTATLTKRVLALEKGQRAVAFIRLGFQVQRPLHPPPHSFTPTCTETRTPPEMFSKTVRPRYHPTNPAAKTFVSSENWGTASVSSTVQKVMVIRCSRTCAMRTSTNIPSTRIFQYLDPQG